MNRRHFLTSSAGLAAGVGLGADLTSAAQTPAPTPTAPAPPGARRQEPAPPVSSLDFRTTLRKALIAAPTEDDLKRMKDAGFDGVEGRVMPVPQAAQMREATEKLGMRIHSVLYGWAEFNSPDRADVDRTFTESQAALQTAQAFGAETVLLVPCRIGGQGAGPRRPGTFAGGPPLRIPRPWEFQPTFDPATGHLSKIVYGDNAPYADYIKAHNHATDASREWVTRLIPTAEKTGVIIALENVSNNLWVTPQLFRHFVASFRSPWVKAYYDIGNHVRFAPPEQWILTLGDLIAKIHVKDYLLDPADPDGRGRSVNIREGSVRWPVLRQALESINYTGWMTIESNGDIPFEERNRRLDLILAGK
ncbi:sugar phosphate isomerase/epimerase family protein [Luteitalea sp.]